MDNYKKQCPIDGGTCGQGGTCFVCENESLGAELAAAKARIAELEEYVEKFACQAKNFPAIHYADDASLIAIRINVGDLRRAADLLKEKE